MISARYIVLIALLISIGAMATDIMLPALDIIGNELGAANPNDVHLIVTAFFFGMAAGQLIVGPLSDSYGRKPIIILGYLVFVAGCLMSIFSTSWSVMLTARVLQGLGAAAPRIVTVAIVRDEYEGRAMARILSLVMAVFIIVPVIAPAIGQGLIYVGGWKSVFISLAVFAIFVTLWFSLQQPETLTVENKRPMHIGVIWHGLVEVLTTRVAFGYTLASGLLFGMFIGYLGSAQQIYQHTFAVGDWFVVYFAIASIAIGAASLFNASLVMRYGMRKLNWIALLTITAGSFIFLVILPLYQGIPSIQLFPLAWVIGNEFDGTLYPLIIGFAVLSLTATLVVAWTDKIGDDV